MKLYTKTGDLGDTGLLHGERVSKADFRVEAYGTVDELNATIGAALVAVWAGVPEGPDRDLVVAALEASQDGLMRLAAVLAAGGRDAPVGVDASDVADLERRIDAAQARTPELRRFVVPGVCAPEAALHVARTVCRRAERRVVALPPENTPADGVTFLNRMSDLLFALARVCIAAAGEEERVWRI